MENTLRVFGPVCAAVCKKGGKRRHFFAYRSTQVFQKKNPFFSTCPFLIFHFLGDPQFSPVLSHVEVGFDDTPATSNKLVVQKPIAEAKHEDDEKQIERHSNWIHKGAPETKFGSWRPRTKHRNSAKHWCQAVDNQFRVSTGRSGLVFFKHDNKLKIWRNPLSWRGP